MKLGEGQASAVRASCEPRLAKAAIAVRLNAATRTVLGVLALSAAARAQQPSPQGADPSDAGVVSVVVQGARVRPPTPPKDRSVAGSVVSGERLRAPGMQASELLRPEPGVAVVESGGIGAPSTASSRGATSAQTPVYLGGVRLNDDLAGTADLSLVPLWLIDRVEIYRGNAPIEADQLGIGGAIFFEPRTPRRLGAEAGALVGSFASRAGWADVSVGSDRASALVGVRVDGSNNDYPYVDDRGTRFDSSDDIVRRRTNAEVRTTDLWALGRADISSHSQATLLVNGVQRDQGVPGLSLLPTREARASLQRSMFAATVRSACSAEPDRCMLTVTSAALLAHSAFQDPLNEIALGAPRLDVTGDRTEHSVLARIDLSDQFTLSPSARAAIERIGVAPEGGAPLNASRMFSRAALGAEWRIADNVTARALASTECNGTSANAPQFCDQFDPSGRVGVQVGRSRLALLANAGRYVRVPTLGELYGISSVVRGNGGLVPEQGITADAGVRAWSGRWGPVQGAFVDVFGFVRFSDDLIAWRRSSLGFVRPYNVGSARVTGLEALGAVEPTTFARIELSATLLDPRDTTASRLTTNDILPFRSRLVLSPRLDLHTRALASSGVDLARVEVRYVYQSSRYADEAGLSVIPAQATLDLEAEVRVAHEHLLGRVRLANLLDQSRFDVIGYGLPGRAVYATMEARW